MVVLAYFLAAAAFGGFIRFFVGDALNFRFPWGTLAVNTVASTLVGWLVTSGVDSQLVLGTGFAGALSTWSSFAYEVTELFRQQRKTAGLVYIVTTLFVGVGGALIGVRLG